MKLLFCDVEIYFYKMTDDFQILRNGSEVRIKGLGNTQEEALVSLAKGFAAYQLPASEKVLGEYLDREIKIGYTREKYLPSDFLNDIIDLEALNKEVYVDVKNLSLNEGVLRANLCGVKKEICAESKGAVYAGSSFRQEGEKWLAEAEIVV